VSNTIPMLEEVEESLEIVQDHTGMPAVICVAAHAGLLLAQKYHSMNDECEVYQIAISNNYSYFCSFITVSCKTCGIQPLRQMKLKFVLLGMFAS
jgi:hypothetical protein